MKRLYFLGFLVFVSIKSFGQTATCAQTLRLARATYEQGRLHEIEGQLKDCLASGFSKDEKQLKVEGYKILCLSYIYLEEAERADDAMLNLLHTDPYFVPNPQVDPAEFVALFKTFRTNPIVRVGATLGGNFTQPTVIDVTKTTNGTAEYSFNFGLQFGIAADYPLTSFSNRLNLHGDLLFQQKKFELTTTDKQGDGDVNSTTAKESQTWISLPIGIQFNILKQRELTPRKYNPYVMLGFSTDLRLGSTLVAERTREGETSLEPKSFDLKSQREKMNFSAFAAAGVKTRFAGGLIGIEFRYNYGLSKINNEVTAYDSEDLYLAYAVPNSIFKLNSVSFAVTYVQNIFKPKKIKRRK